MGIRGKNLVLEVCDNGIGIRNNGSNGSNGRNGLRSLNNRMLRWKGDVQIISGTDGGTEIRLSIPVDADSHIKRIFFR
jgi:signal transduction histidine kinase